jgi:hypothetical protein
MGPPPITSYHSPRLRRDKFKMPFGPRLHGPSGVVSDDGTCQKAGIIPHCIALDAAPARLD